jgi:hypothetical protein
MPEHMKETSAAVAGLAEQLLAQDATAATDSDARVLQLLKENRALQAKLQKRDTGTDTLVTELKAAWLERPVNIDIPPLPVPDKRLIRSEIAVLCLGDWHVGFYHPDGEYAYNLEIAADRARLIVDKFIATVMDRRNSAVIDELHLLLIGDFVEGDIMRPGHNWEVEVPAILQALRYAPDALAAAIVRLMAVFPKIKVIGVAGNHGRNGPPKNPSAPITNWDVGCYETVRLIVEGAIAKSGIKSQIEWDLPLDRYIAKKEDWYAIDHIYDWCICVLHGEGSGGGATPYASMEKMMRKYVDIVADSIDHMVVGHVHIDASIPSNYRQLYINGPLVSASTFARKQVVCASRPSQLAMFYSEANGVISQHVLHATEHKPTGQRTLEAIEKRKNAD